MVPSSALRTLFTIPAQASLQTNGLNFSHHLLAIILDTMELQWVDYVVLTTPPTPHYKIPFSTISVFLVLCLHGKHSSWAICFGHVQCMVAAFIDSLQRNGENKLQELIFGKSGFLGKTRLQTCCSVLGKAIFHPIVTKQLDFRKKASWLLSIVEQCRVSGSRCEVVGAADNTQKDVANDMKKDLEDTAHC